MGTFATSWGERFEKKVIDRKIAQAKTQKRQQMIDEHGYIFCEEVGCKAPNQKPHDCSHDISVNECQNSGRTELAWDVNNITMRCRKCHDIHDASHHR